MMVFVVLCSLLTITPSLILLLLEQIAGGGGSSKFLDSNLTHKRQLKKISLAEVYMAPLFIYISLSSSCSQ